MTTTLSTEQQLEIDQEILECARYGDDDDLRNLLQAGGNVNFKDGGGNTALHKGEKCLPGIPLYSPSPPLPHRVSCTLVYLLCIYCIFTAAANNHVGCLAILKEFSAIYIPNESGNLPIRKLLDSPSVHTSLHLIRTHAALLFIAARLAISMCYLCKL